MACKLTTPPRYHRHYDVYSNFIIKPQHFDMHGTWQIPIFNHYSYKIDNKAYEESNLPHDAILTRTRRRSRVQ